jgi:aspartate kinase
VGSADAIKQSVEIIRSYADRRPIVVVSALQGVTDELLRLARTAAGGEVSASDAGLDALRERHLQAIEGAVGAGADAEDARSALGELMEDLGRMLRGIAALRELSGRSLDLLVSFGERLSAPIVAAALRRSGLRAVAVDARKLIETDDRFTAAEVDFARTSARTAEVLPPLIDRGVVPVVTGFIGAAADGSTTTLGRGGSDYSATIIAGAIGADEVWIWKEVDGVMTADPGAVPGAALLSEISYDEAAEMSYFGAKVLHPKSMIPAIASRIPVRLRNTFRPSAPGTVIGERSAPTPSGVKVVTAIKKLAVVTVEGKGMMGIAGFAAHVFGVAGRSRINILMFTQSSSEQNICLAIEEKDAAALKGALERELRDAVESRAVDRISVDEGLAAVAVVGEGMRGTPGVAAKVFAAVAAEGVSVLAIAQGSSERNISFVIPEKDADKVVRAVHDAFALHQVRMAATV